MSVYVDGFVLPVAKQQLDAYRAWSQKLRAFCKAHGALDYVDCVGDDVRPGPLAVRDDEVVVLSWITYASKADRDRINQEMWNTPEMRAMSETMPFDRARMVSGGFTPISEA